MGERGPEDGRISAREKGFKERHEAKGICLETRGDNPGGHPDSFEKGEREKGLVKKSSLQTMMKPTQWSGEGGVHRLRGAYRGEGESQGGFSEGDLHLRKNAFARKRSPGLNKKTKGAWGAPRKVIVRTRERNLSPRPFFKGGIRHPRNSRGTEGG